MQEYIADLLRRWQLPSAAWNWIIVGVALVLGLLLRLLAGVVLKLQTRWKENNRLFPSTLRHLASPLSYWCPLFTFDLLLPVMQLNRVIRQRLDHAVEIALIIASAWLFVSFVRVVQDQVHRRINIKTPDNLRQRTIITQLIYIRRVITVIVILVTIGAVLLTFGTMRKIGTGLLTSVGIGGVIVGFAAQRSLANLLAGFQIAFTQPIRIDDEVVVEGEWGRIEEITLTYVVVRIWDDRRLVLPINYFIEKPFQNWTRTDSFTTGTALFYVDYTLPVDWLRQEFMQLLQQTELWDKRVAALQVTNLKEQVMEVRTIMSGRNSGQVFDLRCFVRERLLQKINEQYPQCLPKVRWEGGVKAGESNTLQA
jgi:small-conductance mechanosensitive channel